MNPVEYSAFSSFYSEVLSLVAPEDLGEELKPYFRDQIGNALADLQTLIPWLRAFNVNILEKGGVDEFCNASIFQGPVGKVAQVFAYKPGSDCYKYYYRRVSTAALDCWLERQRCFFPDTPPPENCLYRNYVTLSEGEDFLIGTGGGDIIGDLGDLIGSGPSTGPVYGYSAYLTYDEDDCRFKELDPSDRIFAVGPDYKIYAAPRFPCGYNLLVQWNGVRRKWLNSDLVPVDQQLREAVVNYVEHKMAMKERNSQAMAEYFNAYTINLRMLRYRYFDEQETGPHRDCSSGIDQLMSGFIPLYDTVPVPRIPILSEHGAPILGEGEGQTVFPE